MRIWCNMIKSVVLSEHDPARPQTYKVVQSHRSPIGNAGTWLKWWTGDAIPRPSHVAAVEQLAPGSSRVLDLSEMRTALHRHLVALDILNTRFRVSGRPSDYRRSRSELLLTALNNAWGSFLELRPVGTANEFTLESQIGLSAVDQLDAFVVSEAQLEWIWEGGNARRFSLPRQASMEHSWLEPLSIFRFLGSLVTFDQLENQALLRMWAYDFASAAMVIRTQLELAPATEMPVLRMGKAGLLFALATNTFWAPADKGQPQQLLEIIQLLELDHDCVAIRNRLRAARLAYYSGFGELGVPERVVRALNGVHRNRTWDESFNIPRAKL